MISPALAIKGMFGEGEEEGEREGVVVWERGRVVVREGESEASRETLTLSFGLQRVCASVKTKEVQPNVQHNCLYTVNVRLCHMVRANRGTGPCMHLADGTTATVAWATRATMVACGASTWKPTPVRRRLGNT